LGEMFANQASPPLVLSELVIIGSLDKKNVGTQR